MLPKRFNTEQIITTLRWRGLAPDEEGIAGDALEAVVGAQLFRLRQEPSAEGATGRPTLLIRGLFSDAYNDMKWGTLMRQKNNTLEENIEFNSWKVRRALVDIDQEILRGLQRGGDPGKNSTPRAVTQFAVDMVDPWRREEREGSAVAPTCVDQHDRARHRQAGKDPPRQHPVTSKVRLQAERACGRHRHQFANRWDGTGTKP